MKGLCGRTAATGKLFHTHNSWTCKGFQPLREGAVFWAERLQGGSFSHDRAEYVMTGVLNCKKCVSKQKLLCLWTDVVDAESLCYMNSAALHILEKKTKKTGCFEERWEYAHHKCPFPQSDTSSRTWNHVFYLSQEPVVPGEGWEGPLQTVCPSHSLLSWWPAHSITAHSMTVHSITAKLGLNPPLY